MRPNETALRLKRIGLSREQLAERVIRAVSNFDGSYRGAMILAGRLKAIAQMARCDEYWSEKVDDGYEREARSALATLIAQDKGAE